MEVIVKQNLGSAGDIGIYNSAGSLVLNGGAGSLPQTTGLQKVTPVQAAAARTLPPGQYYVALTWSTAGGKIEDATTVTAGAVYHTGMILGAGGSTLPASITLGNITAGVDLYEVSIHQ